MTREWKPGDVAMVKSACCGEAVCLRGNNNDWRGLNGSHTDHGGAVSARPLVVIDPESREQVEQLAQAFLYAANFRRSGTVTEATDYMTLALRDVASPPDQRKPVLRVSVMFTSEKNQPDLFSCETELDSGEDIVRVFDRQTTEPITNAEADALAHVLLDKVLAEVQP